MLTEAVCNFWGPPGKEEEAALAWAFELTYYFKRGVGEAPLVTAIPTWHVHRKGDPAGKAYDYVCGLRLNFWDDSCTGPVHIYCCRGLMTTTHPGDRQPVTIFDKGSAWSLNDCRSPEREQRLRELYGKTPYRWDGRT